MAEIGITPIDGDMDFSGGWSMSDTIRAGQYRYLKNGIITDGGKPMTRPGMRRAFRVLQAGFREAFSFGDEVEGTGFWFPFTFVASAWGNIQGSAFFRFLNDLNTRQIVVSDGNVFVHNIGFVTPVKTIEAISSDEVIKFVQADQLLFMLRGEDKNVLVWDGTDVGFVYVTAGLVNSIPMSGSGAYIGGRLWLTRDRDDIYASDVLDPSSYNYATQKFSISRGDGDEIVRILPFHEDYCLIFKKRKVMYLGGTNAVVQPGTDLSNYVSVGVASDAVGLVAQLAVAVAGEQVFFLSYEGVMNLSRVQQGKLMGDRTPVSRDIQPMIDRINWGFVDCACAVYYRNRVIFAVPIDGSTVNNIGLVYNLSLNGGQGGWEGTIESSLFNPTAFYVDGEKLYFLGTDGAMREMWTNDPWDSEDVFDDTPLRDPLTFYHVGDYVYEVEAGVKTIYVCTREHTDEPVTDSTYWTQVTDPQNLYRIEMDLTTRVYHHGDAGRLVPKRWGTSVVKFRHQNPNLSLYIQPEDYGTESVHIENVQYSQVKYDIANTLDWDPTNINLDFRNPHRQDYSVFIRPGGVVPFLPSSWGWSEGSNWGWNDDNTVLSGHVGEDGFGQGLGCLYDMPLFGGELGEYTVRVRFVYGDDFDMQVNVGGTGGFVFVEPSTTNPQNPYTEITLNANGDLSTNPAFYFILTSGSIHITSIEITGITNFLTMNHTGIDLNVWEHHDIRFIPLVVDNTGVGLRINNTMGRVIIDATVLRATPMRSYMKGR